MSQSLSNVLLHLVFGTKGRRQYIIPKIEQQVYHYFDGCCTGLGCKLYHIGGMPDHVHLLLSLSRTLTIAKLMNELKTNTSKFIKTLNRDYQCFCWQNGYGVFSVSQSNFESVADYILGQKEHHKRVSFTEELLKILRKSQVEFDERYLWD